MKIGGRGRAALPGFPGRMKLGHLVEADPLLLRSVEVGVRPMLEFACRAQKGVGDRARVFLVGDLERAGIAVPGITAFFIGLGPEEVRQDFSEGPAHAPERGPVVVIGAMPPDIEHRVDGAGPPERLAAGLKTASAVETGLRDGLESPVVDLGPAGNHQRDAGGRPDQDPLPVSARLEQTDGHRRVFRKPRRKGRAGGPAADDHVIEIHFRFAVLLFCHKAAGLTGRARRQSLRYERSLGQRFNPRASGAFAPDVSAQNCLDARFGTTLPVAIRLKKC